MCSVEACDGPSPLAGNLAALRTCAGFQDTYRSGQIGFCPISRERDISPDSAKLSAELGDPRIPRLAAPRFSKASSLLESIPAFQGATVSAERAEPT